MANLSVNEIRTRATQFAKRWADAGKESAEKQTFWNEFFHVFGRERRQVAVFEEPVKKLKGQYGAIDLLWPGKLIVEHKSARERVEFLFKLHSEITEPMAALATAKKKGKKAR